MSSVRPFVANHVLIMAAFFSQGFFGAFLAFVTIIFSIAAVVPQAVWTKASRSEGDLSIDTVLSLWRVCFKGSSGDESHTECYKYSDDDLSSGWDNNSEREGAIAGVILCILLASTGFITSLQRKRVSTFVCFFFACKLRMH